MQFDCLIKSFTHSLLSASHSLHNLTQVEKRSTLEKLNNSWQQSIIREQTETYKACVWFRIYSHYIYKHKRRVIWTTLGNTLFFAGQGWDRKGRGLDRKRLGFFFLFFVVFLVRVRVRAPPHPKILTLWICISYAHQLFGSAIAQGTKTSFRTIHLNRGEGEKMISPFHLSVSLSLCLPTHLSYLHYVFYVL